VFVVAVGACDIITGLCRRFCQSSLCCILVGVAAVFLLFIHSFIQSCGVSVWSPITTMGCAASAALSITDQPNDRRRGLASNYSTPTAQPVSLSKQQTIQLITNNNTKTKIQQKDKLLRIWVVVLHLMMDLLQIIRAMVNSWLLFKLVVLTYTLTLIHALPLPRSPAYHSLTIV
jgi:hypothetical protein